MGQRREQISPGTKRKKRTMQKRETVRANRRASKRDPENAPLRNAFYDYTR